MACGGLRPCPKGLCPSGRPTLAGGSLGSRGYGPLALHSCPRAELGVASAASRGRVLALRAAGRTNPLTRHPLGTAGPSGAFWRGVWAGRGVKGGTGGRSPERSAGTGRGCRRSEPLMPLEAIQPIGQGEEQGEAAGPAPAASPARSDAGCNRRGCPSEARSVLGRRKPKIHLLINSFEL